MEDKTSFIPLPKIDEINGKEENFDDYLKKYRKKYLGWLRYHQYLYPKDEISTVVLGCQAPCYYVWLENRHLSSFSRSQLPARNFIAIFYRQIQFKDHTVVAISTNLELSLWLEEDGKDEQLPLPAPIDELFGKEFILEMSTLINEFVYYEERKKFKEVEEQFLKAQTKYLAMKPYFE